MKKFFVIFALFCAFFMVSCGGDSAKKENEQGGKTPVGNIGELNGECYPNNTCNKGLVCDTENNLCVEEPENQSDDSDNNPSEQVNDDTVSDNDNSGTPSEQNDDNPDSTDDSDSVDPCKPNPCENLEHSTGICTADGEKYVCGCDSNYEWNGVSCGAGTKKAQCEPKPAGTVWNDVNGDGTFTQTWNGEAWVPESYPSSFSKTSGVCTFKCASGSAWNGSSCDSAPTTVSECTGLPENAIWNTTAAIVQTYDGVSWEPPATGTYNLTPSQDECHFICKPNYDWTGSQCVAGTQMVECTGLPANAVWNTVSTVSQTWNGTAWTPTSTGIYNTTSSTSECRFKCNTNYTWNNSTCKADSKVSNCTGLIANAQWNTVSTISQTWNGSSWQPSTSGTYNTTASTTECRYKCNSSYFYHSSQCVNPCSSNNCEGMTGCSTGTCNATDWNTYSCECDRGYVWNSSTLKCDALPTCSTAQVTPCKSGSLIWSAGSTNHMTWANAVTYCNNLTEGGFSDWRLPNISELRTLIKNCSGTISSGTCPVNDPGCLSRSCYDSNKCDCAQDMSGKYSVFGDADYFWSSSVPSDHTSSAWYVSFGDGAVFYGYKTDTYSVRCVR
ncbi:DUF1566 domain-containing protein [bacterium]|nr:DUF1566 domain-containing protein [bacterium]